MSMRLIDEADARRRVIAFATGLHSEVLPVDTMMMLITQVPTIDAVPVVRCKDCERRNKSADLTNTVYCPWLKLSMRKEDFCSYGERKEGADNG